MTVREAIRIIEGRRLDFEGHSRFSPAIQASEQVWARDNRRSHVGRSRPGPSASIFEQAGLRRRLRVRDAIEIEKAESNYSAYVPDLPGCVATGATVDEIERVMHDAIRLPFEGLREGEIAPPEPTSVVACAEA